MKYLTLALSAALLTSGCHKAPPLVQAPAPSATPEPAAAPAPEPIKPPSAGAVTAAQKSALVSVRVVAGAIPAKNYAGAVIDRSEFSDPRAVAYLDQNRCVLTLLKDWNEAQLKDPGTKIYVFRNLPDESGEPQCLSFLAHLSKFDPETGLARLVYNQGFSAAADLGYHVEASAPAAPDKGAIVVGYSNPPSIPTSPRFGNFPYGRPTPSAIERKDPAMAQNSPRGRPDPSSTERRPPAMAPNFPHGRPDFSLARKYQEMAISVGSIKMKGDAVVELAFTETDPATPPLETALLVSSPAVLRGFIGKDSNGADVLVPVRQIDTAFQVPELRIVSARFTSAYESVSLILTLEASGGATPPKELSLLRVKTTASELPKLESFAEPYQPITREETVSQMIVTNGHEYRGSLERPTQPGEEMVYLLQAGWKESPQQQAPTTFSRPFVVRLTQSDKGLGLIPVTEGITNLSEAKITPDTLATTLTFDSRVVDGREIAAGREILFELSEAPFWKRFSMEKKSWLPLPPAMGKDVAVAGNRSNLFVLDRTTSTIKRYALPDLAEKASAKLDPVPEQLFEISAGCASDHAPIYVSSNRGLIALDPETLQRRDLALKSPRNAYTSKTREELSQEVTGDGVTLRSSGSSVLTFAADYMGFRPTQEPGMRTADQGSTVSAAYLHNGRKLVSTANPQGTAQELIGPALKGTAGRYSMFPNAPMYFHRDGGKPDAIPPEPAHCIFAAFDQPVPCAEMDMRELTGTIRGYNEKKGGLPRIFFDPASKQVAVLTANHLQLVVRDVPLTAASNKPVLLDWPDATMERGGDFSYTPLLLGEAKVSAELLGTREPTPVKTDGKSISFHLSPSEVSSLLLLNVTLAGPAGTASYGIPINVQGPPIPFLAPPQAAGSAPTPPGSSLSTLRVAHAVNLPLKSSFYESAQSVRNVYGPINGHVVLSVGQRLEVLSLQTSKLVGSIPCPPKAAYYAGDGALYEYDAATRALTRIGIPDLRRGAQFTVPPQGKLLAIGLGTQREHPLTLFLRSSDAAGLTHSSIFAVNSETLRTGAWMQPRFWSSGVVTDGLDMLAGSLYARELPTQLAGSHAGNIFSLGNNLLLLTPTYSIIAGYPAPKDVFGYQIYGNLKAPTGSMTGLIVATSGASFYKNGRAQSTDPYGGSEATPCGRYSLSGNSFNGHRFPSVTVKTLDGQTPLFQIENLGVLSLEDATDESGPFDSPRLMQLGDNGPLLVISKGAHLLEFVELDIPKLALAADPAGFHIISQPSPVVMEGGNFDYQVLVNNPSAVASYRFHNKLAGGSILGDGALHFPAPPNVKEPTFVEVSLEVVGKNGQTLLHEFPVMVLPRRIPDVPTAPAAPGVPGIPGRRPGNRTPVPRQDWRPI